MKTIVFDIETQNFFTDPAVGWNNFAALRISAVGVYDYEADAYQCFEEHEINSVAELFSQSDRLIGFSMHRYDIPVLHHYFKSLPHPNLDLWQKDRVDLLDEIEMVAGQRVSLSKLAELNLGVSKEYKGADAITFYKEGNIDKLKEYCLKDVKLTKELYDLYRKQKYFLVPDRRTDEVIKVTFNVDRISPITEKYATLF